MTKIAFDVDGTLIHQEGFASGPAPDTPRYEVIALFFMLQAIESNEMYIWSGGGLDYATRWAEKLGLIDYCTVVSKGVEEMDIVFDDEEVNLGKVNIRV
jgi:hypothetical protein